MGAENDKGAAEVAGERKKGNIGDRYGSEFFKIVVR